MSPADQRRLLLARGVPPELLFDDSGRSASKAGNRPGFDLLLEAIEAGKVAEVWMTSIDRLARNMPEAIDLSETCRRAGAVICSTDGGAPLDPADPDHALGLDINAAVAASYSRQLARKMRRSIAGRLARNLGVKNRSCFGYCIDRTPGETYRRQMIRHPGNGPIAREIIERFLAGDLLLAQLATWVQERCQTGQPWAHLGGPKLDPTGAPVLDAKGKPKRNKIIPVTPSTLRAWLEHPELRGAGARDALAGPDAWSIPEPLLGAVEWGQVQALLSRSSRGRKCPKLNAQPIHPLSGMVRCGACGRGLHLRSKQRPTGLDRSVFQCPNRGCSSHRHRMRHEPLHWAAEAVVRHHAQQAAMMMQPAPAAAGPTPQQLRQIEALRGAQAVATGELKNQLRAEIVRLETQWRDEQLAAVADQPLAAFLAEHLQDSWSWRVLPLDAPLRRTLYERVGVLVTVESGKVAALGPGEVDLPEEWPVLDDRQWLWPVKLSGRAPSLGDLVEEEELLARWTELTGETVEPSKGDTILSLGDLEENIKARQWIRRHKKAKTVSR
jgi:hypothetical protein